MVEVVEAVARGLCGRSCDTFFCRTGAGSMPPDAIYDFEPQRLRELHQKNQQRCRDAME